MRTILLLAALCLLNASRGVAQTAPPLLAAERSYSITEGLTTEKVAGPGWARTLPIYEANLDRYGFAPGTAFREFEKHLPVLKEMGIGIVWIMPLHPRGVERAFGSPYSVRDYYDTYPKFGTREDFRHLVRRAHELGLYVLMDWVPVHTSWDHAWIRQFPEFYQKDAAGKITQSGPWKDVARLDYGKEGAWNRPLWDAMRDAMAYWVREFQIDGYRVDVAGAVPNAFWDWATPQLRRLRPIFLLAEANPPHLHPNFDMTFEWDLPPVLLKIVAGELPATAIDDTLRKHAQTYPRGAIRMRFIDNHDWHNDRYTVLSRLPESAPALMTLCATLPGKPLVYNGQEMGHSLLDPPGSVDERRRSPVWQFYRKLLNAHRTHPAL